MKRLLLLIMVLGFMSGCAKRVTCNSPAYVHDIEHYSQAQIYEASKRWVAMKYVSAQNVIQYDNVHEGVLIGKGNTPYGEHRVKYAIRIDVKPERFKMSFLDIHWSTAEGQSVLMKQKRCNWFLNNVFPEYPREFIQYVTQEMENEKAW